MTGQLKDTIRDMCIAQGYVPQGCLLPGPIVWALVQDGKDPCHGCNFERAVCGGRPRGDEVGSEDGGCGCGSWREVERLRAENKRLRRVRDTAEEEQFKSNGLREALAASWEE